MMRSSAMSLNLISNWSKVTAAPFFASKRTAGLPVPLFSKKFEQDQSFCLSLERSLIHLYCSVASITDILVSQRSRNITLSKMLNITKIGTLPFGEINRQYLLKICLPKFPPNFPLDRLLLTVMYYSVLKQVSVFFFAYQ